MSASGESAGVTGREREEFRGVMEMFSIRFRHDGNANVYFFITFNFDIISTYRKTARPMQRNSIFRLSRSPTVGCIHLSELIELYA